MRATRVRHERRALSVSSRGEGCVRRSESGQCACSCVWSSEGPHQLRGEQAGGKRSERASERAAGGWVGRQSKFPLGIVKESCIIIFARDA